MIPEQLLKDLSLMAARVRDLEAQMAQVRKELDQHYSNHQVEANNRASSNNP